MLGFYNYTVILTYLGMLFGFTGITFTCGGNLSASLICLAAAGVCDIFDGKVASTMKRTRQEKLFGIQIDSLSDLICFGVLPALIVYTSSENRFRIVPSAIYLLCALIRLAWFNVDETERQGKEKGRRTIYYGLPVTTAAIIIPVVMDVCTKFGGNAALIGSLTLLIMSAAFLTPFRIKRPGVLCNAGALLIGVVSVALLASAGMIV